MRRSQLFASLSVLGLLGTARALEAQSSGEIKPAGKEVTLAIGGFMQVQAEFGDQGDARFSNDNDRFYLRRARLSASGNFLEDFDFRLEMDLAGSLSNTSSLRAQLTDGYVTWNRHPESNIRFGQFKTGFGMEHLFSDTRLHTIERSLAVDRLTLGRQLGVQVSGELLEKRLNYTVGTFNGNGVNNNFNDDDRFVGTARLGAVPWQGKVQGRPASWSVAGNVFSTEDTNVPQAPELGFDSTPSTPEPDNIFSGERMGWGLDTQLVAGRLEVWAEVLRVNWEPTSGRPLDELESSGWYLQGLYFVVPDRLQVLLKAESFDPRRETGGDVTETGTAGVNWFFKGHDLKLMLNYLRVQSDLFPEDQDKILARFQVIF